MSKIRMDFFGELDIVLSQHFLDFAGSLQGVVFFARDEVPANLILRYVQLIGICPPRVDPDEATDGKTSLQRRVHCHTASL